MKKKISNYNFKIWVCYDPVEPDRIIKVFTDKEKAYKFISKFNQYLDPIQVIELNISYIVERMRKEMRFTV